MLLGDGHARVQVLFQGKTVARYEGLLGERGADPTLYFKMGIYRDTAEEVQKIYLSNFERRLHTVQDELFK